MVKRTTPKGQLLSKLGNMKAGEVASLSRIGSLETTNAEFGKLFKENPAAALATKGIVVDDLTAGKLATKVAGLAGGPGSLAATEVEVSVKVKF